MKVFLQPPAHLSLAMFRVACALELTAPPDVQIVNHEDKADLLILHVIGPDAINYRADKKCAVMQYCLNTAGTPVTWWQPLWQRAAATWSYYDLTPYACPRFYHAPLGVAESFTDEFTPVPRVFGALTSGYVTGPGAEAIEEVTRACAAAGYRSVHLGPRPVGGDPATKYHVTGLIPDAKLAALYHQTRYVSGLRFVEGFELCALEGLACGARPIMFKRTDAKWFHGHARYVTEQGGENLVRELQDIIAQDPEPVTPEERAVVLAKFNWDTLARGFWNTIMEAV